MDPIAQLGHTAYHALCVAFAAQHKDKLYAPETDVLLEEARELLGISEDDDAEIRSEIEKDPMIAALRRGEMPPGGVRLPATSPTARPAGSMPPPSAPAAAGAAAGGAYETPFSAPAQQAAATKSASKKAAAPPAAAAAGGGSSSTLVGRKLQRLFPDLSPPWVTGTIVQFNPANGKHLIAYGPPLRKELWDSIEDFAPQNFRWVEPGPEPAASAGGGVSKVAGGSKPGGASKSTSKVTTPKAAAPPPPPPPPPPAPRPVAPALPVPGGPSTFHSTGVSLTAAPYSDGFLKACLAKNRPEDLGTMLSSLDDREAAVARELLGMIEDPADAAELNRLLAESQQLGQREAQLRAELRGLGVLG